MKRLQLAGGWKKFAIPTEICGHLEITGVHSQMRELSGGVKNPVKSLLGDGLSNSSEKKKGRRFAPRGPSLGRKRPGRAAGHLCPAGSIWQRKMTVSRGRKQNVAQMVKFSAPYADEHPLTICIIYICLNLMQPFTGRMAICDLLQCNMKQALRGARPSPRRVLVDRGRAR